MIDCKSIGFLLLSALLLPAQTPVEPTTQPKVTPRVAVTPLPSRVVRPSAAVRARGPEFMLVEAEIEKEKAACATLQEAPGNADLEKLLDRGLKIIQSVRRGYLVVGRVVLDGPGDPRDVSAQMAILPGGWFADAVGDLTNPIGFRLHGYAPLDLPMKGRKGNVIDLGEVHLQPVPPEQLVPLRGKITLEGKLAPHSASVSLSPLHEPINTPGNGVAARSHFAKPIEAKIDAQGVVSGTGFSPMKYHARVSASGYLTRSVTAEFRAGVGADLGSINLEAPKRLVLTYVMAKERPFDFTQGGKRLEMLGGGHWKATPDIFGWDLDFIQEAGAFRMRANYGPCELLDLGAGHVADFVEPLNSAKPPRMPFTHAVESGHVYLLHQGRWQRWLAFRVEVER